MPPSRKAPRRRLLDAVSEFQLARVARCAGRLVDRPFRNRVKARDVCALRAGRIDDAPVVEPGRFVAAVLNGKHEQARIGQAGRVGLLPLRPDDVVNRISCPLCRFALADVDVVAAVLHHRARAIRDHLTGRKIADHIGGAICAEHLRHAGRLPLLVDRGMAFAARRRAGIRAGRGAGRTDRSVRRGPPQRRRVSVEAGRCVRPARVQDRQRLASRAGQRALCLHDVRERRRRAVVVAERHLDHTEGVERVDLFVVQAERHKQRAPCVDILAACSGYSSQHEIAPWREARRGRGAMRRGVSGAGVSAFVRYRRASRALWSARSRADCFAAMSATITSREGFSGSRRSERRGTVERRWVVAHLGAGARGELVGFSQDDRAGIALDKCVGQIALGARRVGVPRAAKRRPLGGIVDFVEDRERRSPRAQGVVGLLRKRERRHHQEKRHVSEPAHDDVGRLSFKIRLREPFSARVKVLTLTARAAMLRAIEGHYAFMGDCDSHLRFR